MEVRRLRILREFADRGSVGAVADAMNLTPSAVSQQLKVLARESGIDLLEQQGRGVRLTDAGQALVLRADEVIAAVDRAQDEMALYRGSSGGSVRLAMFPSAAALLLPGVLTAMASSGIDVVARDDNDVPYPQAHEALSDNDVVVTHRDERSPSVASPRIHRLVIMREPVDLAVSGDHWLAGRDSVTLTELADEDWISVLGGFPVDDVLSSLATVTGVQPRIVHRINDFTVIEAMVDAGLGIALMPRWAVRRPGLRRLELTGVRAARIYEVLHRPRATERVAVAELVAALVAECGAVTSAATTGTDVGEAGPNMPGVRRSRSR